VTVSAGRARKLAYAVVVLLVVGGVAGSLRVVRVATAHVGSQVRQEQLAYLQKRLDDGAAERMQAQFPEGYFFTNALTGLAAGQPAEPGDAAALAAVRRALTAIESPAGIGRFRGQTGPVNGVFWAGWALMLAVEQARLSTEAEDRQEVVERATEIRDAFSDDADGFLDSYPGKVWPVDNMVAVAALARANALVPVPGAAAVVSGWPARIAGVRDPATGLLPHKLGPDGSVVEGPRGSSQALLLAFEPDVDPNLAARDYRSFVTTFVVRRFGLAGVREFPAGTAGTADVDSGPLLFGVSASASAVALAAASRQRDIQLVRALNAEAEFLGVPFTWRGERRYGFGALPVGDAFLAWTRAQNPSSAPTGSLQSPRPLWLLWGVVPLLPGTIAAALLVGFRRRRATAAPSKATERADHVEL
jgi:hypothetical protein